MIEALDIDVKVNKHYSYLCEAVNMDSAYFYLF
jgi:hypothetical protein